MERFVKLCKESSQSVDREEQVRIVKRLLDNKELDPGKKDTNGWYPIHYAAEYGCLQIIDLLLRHCDPYVTTTSRARSTALHIACAKRRLDVVQALLQHYPSGAPPKKDKEGNTPVHLACKIGSLEITHRLLSKYPTSSIYEVNKKGVTPLGFAVSGNHSAVARHLLSLSTGNPAQKFSDFRQNFITFKHEQSLDHPVSIFVLGNRGVGKSTLIKSLQGEVYMKHALGVPDIEHYYGGVLPSDAFNNEYGRVKFYKLAGCRQSTQEDIFLSLAEPAHSLFLIILSFKDEQKEIEANLLFWLSFIHHQYRSISVKPRVVVVGSQKLGAIHLESRTHLRLVYDNVISSHSELCSCFHFLAKYSMDCRKSESAGMRQLRSMLAQKCREMRPIGGEMNVPSLCYVLFSALHDIKPPTTDIPALDVSEIEYHISQSASEEQPCSLLSLLPVTAEDLSPLLETLEERKAIVTVKQHDPRDPCVIYNEYELLLRINRSLLQRFIRVSQNGAVMQVEELCKCLSTVPLSPEVLLNILNRFKVLEDLSDGNSTMYFLPAILHKVRFPDHPLTWEPDPKSTPGFAWCIVPQSNQITPFFMPRCLYFMLYELFTSTKGKDYDKIVISESGLYCKHATELEVYITIDSSMVNLHMRCKKDEVVTCLKYRNTFLSVIHQQRELLQPSLKATEYIVPMEEVQFPIQKVKHVVSHGKPVVELKNAIVTTSTNENIPRELCIEPFIWCKKLSKEHLQCLLDPSQINIPISREFFQDLSQKMDGKWEVLFADPTDLLQIESTSETSAEELSVGVSGTRSQIEDPRLPQYGEILEVFSTISLFRSISQFISALKNLESVSMSLSQLQDEGSGNEVVGISQTKISAGELKSESETPASKSKEPSHSLSLTPGASSNLSVHENVPNLEGEKCSHTNAYDIQFIISPEQIQCSSSGAKFQHKVHSIAFYVPPGAVTDGSYMVLKFGVAITGSFTYPDKIMPVSPILWVQVHFCGDQGELRKPIEITLPHAVNCKEGSSLLHFMCAYEKKHQITFKRTWKRAKISPNKGTLLSTLSKQQYFICIGGKSCRDVFAKTEYCIIYVAPRQRIDNVWSIQFFITYTLPACIEIVRQKFGNDYTVSVTTFHFDTLDGRKPSIHVHFQQVMPEKWMIMREGSPQKIHPIHIDFGSAMGTYPPKYTFSIYGHDAIRESFATFKFKGVLPANLVYEVPLIYGSSHQPLRKTGRFPKTQQMKHRKSTDSQSSSDQTYSTPQHSLPHMQSELVPDTQPTKLNEKKQKLVNGQPHDVKYIGKDIYKQIKFIYIGKKDSLLWKKYGIELQFPSSLSKAHIEGTISVLSTDDDNYIFPEESEIISAVYKISANKSFPEPVTVKLQHCLPTDSAKEVSLMSFVIANTEHGPPYKFQTLSGGCFKHGSSYGEIQLTHFSVLGIIKWCKWKLGLPRPFWASVYYFQNGTASFVVTKNLEAHISAVKDENRSALLRSEFSMIIDRHSTGIELETLTDSSWKVIPHIIPARINITVVLDYQPGRAIPQITMEVRCKEEEQPTENFVMVKFRGVREPASFRLMCTHSTDMTSTVPRSAQFSDPLPRVAAEPTVDQLYRLQGRSGRTVRVIQTAAPSWRRLAYSLHLTGPVVDSIELSSQFQVVTACEKALRHWMSTGTRQPVVWETLLQALQDAELHTLATELKLVLTD